MAVEPVDDPRDPRLADYRDLRQPARHGTGVFVVEGAAAVRHLLRAGRFAVRSIVATPSQLEAVRDLLVDERASVPVLLAGHPVIREVAGFDFHRGCVAAADRGPELAPAHLLDPPGPRTLVVLERLADPENVGGVFRNAMAFGADAVLLSPGCADPLNRKAIRVSSAGSLRLPFARAPAWPDVLHDLRGAGYTVLALAPDGPLDLADVRALSDRRALLVGSEGHGLSAPARAAADLTARITMATGVDSLNVGTACGIALHHLWALRSRPRGHSHESHR